MCRRSFTCFTCIVLASILFVPSRARAAEDPQQFGIYRATFDGKEAKGILFDATRQMTHARVSPDHQMITFTRYNKMVKGLAEESGGYEETEIMLARLDGTKLESVVPPKKGILATNSSWSPDGKSLIYISTDNPERKPTILRLDLATRKSTRVPTPPQLLVADPQQVGKQIVFTVKGVVDCVWLMNADGSSARQVSHPKFNGPKPANSIHTRGDYDPKLSPDGSRVAFMRYFGGENWHVIVVDVKTGQEKDLSAAETTDGLPEWSGDGKKLLFWHVDRKNLRQIGIVTMKPDGSDRQMVPLPRRVMHSHANFFPGKDLSPQTKIIYTAKKNMWIP